MRNYISNTWKEKNKVTKITCIMKLIAAVLLAFLLITNWTTIIDKGQISRSGIMKMGLLAVIWLVGVLFAFYRPDFGERKNRIISILYAAATPFFLFIAMETAIYSYFDSTTMTPKIIGLNLLMILLIELFFLVVTNSLRWGPTLAGVLCVIFAVANEMIYMFRGNPILVSDFATIGTAFDVADNYTLTFEFTTYVPVLALFTFIVIGGALRQTRVVKKRRYQAAAFVAVLVIIGGFLNKVVLSDYLKEQGVVFRMFRPMDSYRKYGNLVILARSAAFAAPEVPEGYSVEAAEEIAERYPSDAADTASGERPNIIVVINESFADLHSLGDFETNEDYMPYVHSLGENCVTGYTYASIVGGQTANTEFEILTNDSMAFMPAQSVVFQLYLKTPQPSLITSLKSQDYVGNDAIHLWTMKNYRRDVVYPLLGFDNFYYKGNNQVPLEYLRDYTSDICNNHNIIANYEAHRENSDAPYVNYSVTMQNHGPFEGTFDNFQQEITLEGLEGTYASEEQYLSLIKASDDAFRELTEYFQQVEEPTVILMTGDHQPKLSDDFLDEITDGQYDSWSTEQMMARYQVPFVIWSNDSMETQNIPKTSMNYLQTILMDAIDAPLTGYQKFLNEMRQEVPVITAFGYWGADGKFYSLDDETSPYYHWLYDYSIVEYNTLQDPNHRVEGFFDLK